MPQPPSENFDERPLKWSQSPGRMPLPARFRHHQVVSLGNADMDGILAVRIGRIALRPGTYGRTVSKVIVSFMSVCNSRNTMVSPVYARSNGV